jgi:signal transduction histidine kinase
MRGLSTQHVELQSAAGDADAILAEVEAHGRNFLSINQELRRTASEAAGLLAEMEAKNRELAKTNREISKANAYAAELIGEIESKNARIDTLNRTLATANATAAELVAELEIQRTQLESANAALRETNQEKAHILGVVAHDLRGGIGGMGGLADVLAEELPRNDPEIVENVRLLREESRRLLNLLSTLLDMSRLEQGRLELALEIADIRHVLRESLRYHARFAERKRQTLRDDLAFQPLPAAFDPVRMRQVLDNLLSNAIKYTPPGGTILLRACKEADRIVIEVVDSGPGLTEEDSKKLFRGFQQLSAKPTGGEESHGLGLAIAKKVVESHRGRIWAHNNTPGPGAAFGLSLPAR